jgi:hypothetical protein
MKYSVLGLGVLTATYCGLGATACGDDGTSQAGPDGGVPVVVSATATATATAAPAVSVAAPLPAAPPAPAPVTSPPVVSPADGGAGGSPALGEDGAGGATDPGELCEVPASFSVFARSDTDEVWDDNDFSDISIEGSCPILVTATWPHEEGWQDADPSEANLEQTHFTLDVFEGSDLTNKQLELTIELTDDQRGPNATTGGYIASILSVSRYTYEVLVEDTESDVVALADGGVPGDVADASATNGLSDAGAAASMLDGSAEAGLLTDAGGADGGASVAEEPVFLTMTGYVEAEAHPDDRVILRHVGDRATVIFPLPASTGEFDSFDPTQVIKINARIYSMFTGDEVGMVSVGSEDGMAEDDGAPTGNTSAGADGGIADASAMSVMTDAGVMSPMSSSPIGDGGPTSDASPADAPALSGGEGSPGPTRVYDYLTSQFAITKFRITDVGAP